MNLPEKKAAVFRAVLKLLRQGRPLGDLKVSEIAEAAGIGKGTVYEYFPSREELLRDAMQYSRAQGFQELYAAISGAEGEEDHVLLSPTQNIQIPTGKIAVPGSITWEEA